jgi:beta-amylase
VVNQVVVSFHACGNGVGDNVEIPLPNWVTEIGKQNPDIFYKDAAGIPDYEYLSLAVDNEPVLNEILEKMATVNLKNLAFSTFSF